MKYHQIDFMYESQYCIESNSIDLIISSVPIKILEKELLDLFIIFDNIMRPRGTILIDAPASLDIESWFNEIDLWFCWKMVDAHSVRMYSGVDQTIYEFQKLIEIDSYVNLDAPYTRPMGHPCEFCQDLIRELISVFSKVGDTVLDPFCGTGTVPGEADSLGRVGIGCDMRPESNIREEYREIRC